MGQRSGNCLTRDQPNFHWIDEIKSDRPAGNCRCELMASSARDWAADLKAAIKRDFPLGGFTVREENGRVMLQKRWRDSGQRRNAVLPFAWNEGRHTDILGFIAKVNDHIQKGMNLKEAVHLQWPVTGEAGAGPKATTNWPEIVDRFREHKVGSGQIKASTWQLNYRKLFSDALAVLASSNAPTNGPALVQAMAQGDPGTCGRIRRVERVSGMLKFAVKKCGIDQRWLPPTDEDLADIKGHKNPNVPAKALNAGAAIPIKDDQFLALLDGIEDPRWKLAVGLCGVFGLRPVELKYIRADGDGLWCDYQKRNGTGSSPKRHIEALDPLQRPGLGAQLLVTLSSGAVKLPPLGDTDKVSAERMHTHLRRRSVWREMRQAGIETGNGRLTPYSFRHGYAYRSAMEYGLPVRVAARLMGHSLEVHMKHYGKWVDAVAVQSTVEAARARVLSN